MIILGFEHFDPLKGACPETFPEYGKDIIARSRKLISNRTASDISQIIGFINWLIEKSPAREDSLKQLNLMITNVDTDEELSNNEVQILDRDFNTSTYALKAFQANISLPLHDNISNLLWSEIFAVLTLSLIEKAVDDEKYYANWNHDASPDWLYEWRILSHSSYWLIEAMDAIATAEGFRNTEVQEIASKEKISTRNTMAAIQRHAKTNQAILDLTTFFNAGTFKSMRNSAQIFCEKYPDKVNHLAHYNRIRTLTEGLSAHLRGMRRSLFDNHVTQV